MYLGRIVEDGTADQIFDAPPGELPSLTQSFVGCRFRSRCPVSIPACAEIDPALESVNEAEHSAACLLVGANKY